MSDAVPEQELTRALSPSSTPQSTTTAPEATDNGPRVDSDDGSPDFVAMLDNVDTVPMSPGSSETEVYQAPNCSLPSFRPVIGTDFTWGDVSGQVFTNMIEEAYSQIVH